jgi:hypothetical protein
LKATNARAERAEKRATANALRVQIDELNAALAVAKVEADWASAEERQRADRLNEQVEALSAEFVRAEKQVEAVICRAERAEAGRDAERARAEALRRTIDELIAGQAMMAERHTRERAVAQQDAHAAQQAVAELSRAEAERKARGSWTRRGVAGRVAIPARIGPVDFGLLGGMIAVRCPHEFNPLMQRAGGVWEPGSRRWLIERRRIGPVIRALRRETDLLFRRVGLEPGRASGGRGNGAMGAKQAVMRAVREMIRFNPDAAKAVAAIRQRGLPRREAQEELARAMTGCMWEASRGMPDRWLAVLAALEQGKSAASLFPDDPYSEPDETHP